LGAAVFGHFKLKALPEKLKAEVLADAKLAAAVLLADAVLASARIKAEAKVVKEDK
jgi:isoprenylcysteine carboxyl methyltransferase (ICMT) family protein YpbQ